MSETSKLYAVAFLVASADLPAAKTGTIAFFDSWQPDHAEDRDKLFPDALSPTGLKPPTHRLCFQHRMSQAMLDATVAYRDKHRVPLDITAVKKIGVDTPLAEIQAAKSAWIRSQGLVVVDGE